MSAIKEAAPTMPDRSRDATGAFVNTSSIIPQTAAGVNFALPALSPCGTFLLGDMRQPRTTHKRFLESDLPNVLQVEAPADTVITFEENMSATILDVDVHDWKDKPSDEHIAAIASDLYPAPDFWWRSHGRGLKAIFCGQQHKAKAISAALCVPHDMEVEVQRHTRHPNALSTKHPGSQCGDVHINQQTSQTDFRFTARGPATPEDREAELLRLGLTDGERHDHSLCPLDGEADSGAGDCVVVLNDVVYCHRCAAKGIVYRSGMKPGVYPIFAHSSQNGVLFSLAGSRMHWPQAIVILQQEYPNRSESFLRGAYELALLANTKEGDPRLQMAFNPANNFLLTDHGPICTAAGAAFTLSPDACCSLPYCVDAYEVEKGGKKVWVQKVIKEKRAALIDGRATGYPRIRLVNGLRLREPAPGEYYHTINTNQPYPPKLLTLEEILSEQECQQELSKAFPGIDYTYLQASLCAAICGECGEGQPPMVVVTGPSGSGKTMTLTVASGFLGDETLKLEVSPELEKFNRLIGVALAQGRRFLLFDELARVQRLFERMGFLLQVSSKMDYRLLHGNGQVSAHCCGAFFFTCINLPPFLANSAEFNRRVRYVRLNRKAGDWGATCGGDAATWRHRSERNAKVADSIVTSSWLLCKEHNFHFSAVADELGLQRSVSEELAQQKRSCLLDLYQHVCFGGVHRILIPESSRFPHNWIDLTRDNHARELLDVLEPLDDPDQQAKAMKLLKTQLESEPWNEVLGIAAPTIGCELRIHGTRFGLRFIEQGTMRGEARINEQLPRLDGESVPAPTPAPEPAPEDDPMQAALADGGLPVWVNS